MSKTRYNIDRNYVIEKKIKLIKDDDRSFSMVVMWMVKLAPQNSKKMIDFIKTNFKDSDETSMYKRFRKIDKDTLQCLVCNQKLIKREELMELLRKNETHILNNEVLEVELKLCNPTTKEESEELSRKYWPHIWKGNPIMQGLQQQRFDFVDIENNLREISQIANKQDDFALPIVTRVCDPKTKQVLATAVDTRFKNCIYHSVINSVLQVADKESEKKNEGLSNKDTYLCLNYDVYSTHEPCSYCCMALIHSRIGRFFFIKESSKTGGITRYKIDSNKKLNWSFDSFQWCGDDIDLKDIGTDIFV